jgi:hypothetical protein
MEPLLKLLTDEWSVLQQSPRLFIIAVVLASGAIWLALDWKYSAQIANLERRLSLKDDQIQDYKSKLNGASPDEAKRRLDELDLTVKKLRDALASLDAFEPYTPLSDLQSKTISDAFKSLTPPRMFISFAAPDQSASKLAGQFAKVFKSVGIQSPMSVSGFDGDDDFGIQLLVRHRDSPDKLTLDYINAFKQSNIDFKLIEMPTEPGYEAFNFVIYVGPKRKISP